MKNLLLLIIFLSTQTGLIADTGYRCSDDKVKEISFSQKEGAVKVTTIYFGTEMISDEVVLKVDATDGITSFSLTTDSDILLYGVNYDEANSEITLDFSGIPSGRYNISIETKKGLKYFKPIHKD